MSDVLDILVLWLVIYNLLKILQGSRAMQMALGLLALFFVRIMADFFNMVVLSKTVGSLFNIIPVAIIVLFQTEIRKFLATMGRNPFFTIADESLPAQMSEVFQAASEFSNKRIGALIIFERGQSLKSYAEGGTLLDAIPSYSLICDIFQPKSQLHDGAVIIANQRIVSAASVLPLSQNYLLPKRYGTRHRAAVGISEETDCLSMVVSEETGEISFAMNGTIYKPKNTKNESLIRLFRDLMQLGGPKQQSWQGKVLKWVKKYRNRGAKAEEGQVS